MKFNQTPVPLVAQTWGNSEKPLLLCLHGWLDNSQSFAELAQYLSNDFYIVSLDWSGHGMSDHRPGNYPYHWADYLLDLAAVIEELPKPPLAIIGHSLGGIVASAFVAISPESINRLVLIESFGPVTAKPGQTREQLHTSVNQHLSRLKKEKVAKPFELSRMIEARAKLSGLTPAQVQPMLERNARKVAGGWLWRSDARLNSASPIKMSEAQAKELLKPLTTPTLLIQGNCSAHKVNRYLEQRRDWWRALTVKSVDGGHHCHMHSAQDTANKIRIWLANTGLR
ncbi:alpha/beta fold hydrolase [Paraferrimonas haliotis]|uniref:Alpha/beta hydrolase n=1 Tax=Paraferrimonas haliotis TaxID=2013866 RepID=A0AA37U1V3_9GAMM|nr:alpha/beta hydrolase [Paraferrimonas haliotis]GLS84746.1 alpha/beta hydrolase [Paraferrimonas haliotis]